MGIPDDPPLLPTDQRPTRADAPTTRTPADGVPARRDGEAKRVVRIGKYEVFKHIATGGMGAVYRARDTETGREVALKVLPPELAAKPAMLERFRREARSASKLRHENVVSVHEFGELQGTSYLAMEFVEGTDLHEEIKRIGMFDPEEARQIVLQAARALRAANEQAIVHRDIKPSNFLMSRKSGRLVVKLTDFGLAREVDADEFRVTRAGTTVGTVDYMAPEQARDSGAADIRSDLYSLGATWYHLLVGHAPFPEGGLGERLIKIMQDPPPDPRELNPKVSDETWAVLERLLAKDAADRYQTPDELIDDLLTLQGKAVARPKPKAAKKVRRVAATARRVTDDTSADEPSHSRRVWYAVAGLGAAVLIAGAIVAAAMPRRVPPVEAGTGNEPPPSSLVKTNLDPVPPPDRDPPRPGPKLDLPPSETPQPTPVVRTIPLLAPAPAEAELRALRTQIEAPWKDVAPVTGDPVVLQRGATGDRFRSLAAACKAAPAGKPLVIEVRDNGPLFELPAGVVEGRDVVLRAGKGYRPLIIWDLPATPAAPGDDVPTFLTVRKGRLTVEGLEFAWRWPDGRVGAAMFLDVQDGDLTVRDCTVSAAGQPRGGVTLARLRGESARCRMERCHARGAGLIALDLHAPAARVLIDTCLLVGGQQPLVQVRSADQNPPHIRVVRSTLIGGPALVALRPVAGEQSPALGWLAWDSLLSRTNQGEGGNLLTVADAADSRNVEWKAVNTLYAGWNHLLAGAASLPGDDLVAWRRHWGRTDTDGVSREPWPEQVFGEPASQPAAAYQPAGRVRFAATVAPDRPLGCDLAALPPCRDGWMAQFLTPGAGVVEPLADDSPPEIPPSVDGRYHGGRIDQKEVADLGDFLTRAQASWKLGPKVVLHLAGSGDWPTSPIRVKDTSLVLYFEEPADKDTPRPVLTPGRAAGGGPLIEVTNGGLDLIGANLRTPDLDSTRVSSLVKVSGGPLRLHRCRLEGPQQKAPDAWQTAVAFDGSGDPEKAAACTINESVLLSSAAGVSVTGVGARLAVRQSLLVAGGDAVQLLPGPKCRDRAAVQCSLENVTVAAKRSVVRLGDAPSAGVPAEAVLVKARECAYLNPFSATVPLKAGMLTCDGEALSRGLLLWSGVREAFDPRLHFTVASLSAGIPDARERYTPWFAGWRGLWGMSGVQEPRELTVYPVFPSGRWQLDRLALKLRDPVGANLDRLNLKSLVPAKKP